MTSATTMAVLAVAVVGSRSFPLATERVLARLRMLRDDWPTHRLHIVSGGAVGVDRASVAAAKRLGMDYTVHQPEWTKYGKAAGFIRNDLILDDSDRVLAFWDFVSSGTRDTLWKAMRRHLPIEIYDADGEPAGRRLEAEFSHGF